MAQQVVTTSKKFSLAAPDWLKAFLVAAISPIVPIILQSLNAGSFVIDWKTVGTTALAAGLAYLAKNFFTPAQTTITGTPAPGATTTVIIPPKEAGAKEKPIIRETPNN